MSAGSSTPEQLEYLTTRQVARICGVHPERLVRMFRDNRLAQGERTTNPLADKDLRQSLGKEIVKDEVAPFMTIRCHFVTYQCHLACF